jgi:alpha-beta hydrolase superfamily lysophospholipase
MSEPDFKQDVLDSPSSAKLAVWRREAAGTPRGIVHINHGLAEHGGRYGPFAEMLASRGYHVVAQDHRGHGATTAPDGAPRRFADEDGWTKLMTDVAAVNADARTRWPGLPLIIFGHSMGGVVAFNHVLRDPESIDGAAIWNANLALGPVKTVMRIVLFFEALVGGPFTPSHTLDKLTFKAWNKRFPEGRSDADWLSRDTEEVDKYVNDPVCGWPSSVSLWRDFLRGVEYTEDRTRLDAVPHALPFNMRAGSKDPATEGGSAIRKLYKRLRRAKFEDLDFKVLKGFRHETLNEVGREAQMEEFANWLDRLTK